MAALLQATAARRLLRPEYVRFLGGRSGSPNRSWTGKPVARRGRPDCCVACRQCGGASTATLRAARRSGIAIDSSYFAPHLNGVCRLPAELSHPVCLEGIIEVPITWFRDGLNRIRPAQLCACSIGEFEHILKDAWSRGWRVVTVLSHSFELVRRRLPEQPQKVMRLHDRQLLDLCRLLATNSDKFVSGTFGELDPKTVLGDAAPGCLHSSLGQTIRRYCEQAAGRLW